MKSIRAILVLSALVSLPVLADEPAPAPTAAAASATATAKAKDGKKAAPKAPAGSANMVVTKDAETGELRPATAEERQKLLGRRPQAAAAHEVVILPDGTAMVELGEADMNYAVATRNADGSLAQGCVHGPDAARKAATSPAPKTPPPAPAPPTDR